MTPAPAPSGRRLAGPSGPGGRSTAARSPFVLLIVVLLAGGLISLLLLNAAVNQDSFTLSRLQKQTDQLTDEQQALQQEVDQYSAPGALDKQARRLGMVPGGNPAFLSRDGAVRGDPDEATAPPPLTSSAPQTASLTSSATPTSFRSPSSPPTSFPSASGGAVPTLRAGTSAQEGVQEGP